MSHVSSVCECCLCVYFVCVCVCVCLRVFAHAHTSVLRSDQCFSRHPIMWSVIYVTGCVAGVEGSWPCQTSHMLCWFGSDKQLLCHFQADVELTDAGIGKTTRACETLHSERRACMNWVKLQWTSNRTVRVKQCPQRTEERHSWNWNTVLKADVLQEQPKEKKVYWEKQLWEVWNI